MLFLLQLPVVVFSKEVIKIIQLWKFCKHHFTFTLCKTFMICINTFMKPSFQAHYRICTPILYIHSGLNVVKISYKNLEFFCNINTKRDVHILTAALSVYNLLKALFSSRWHITIDIIWLSSRVVMNILTLGVHLIVFNANYVQKHFVYQPEFALD